MKIALGYVTGGDPDNEFKASCDRFLEFDSRERKLTLLQGYITGLYVDNNRNDLVRDFLKIPADYLLMVDDDMKFEPWMPYALLDDMTENNRAIEGALYFGILHGKIKPVWFLEHEGNISNVGRFTTGEVVPLDGVGMGFTLIRRDVFETIAKVPEYRDDPWTWYGRDIVKISDKPTHIGEDLCFCLRAKKCGFQTWGNAKFEAGHRKKITLNFELFRLLYEEAKRKDEEY